MPPAGFEPATHGLEDRVSSSPSRRPPQQGASRSDGALVSPSLTSGGKCVHIRVHVAVAGRESPVLRPVACGDTRNHNPRVGGSSPSSGIGVFAGIHPVSRGFRGLCAAHVDRYEPLETARWLTKQSNEQSNLRRRGRNSPVGKPGFPVVPFEGPGALLPGAARPRGDRGQRPVGRCLARPH